MSREMVSDPGHSKLSVSQRFNSESFLFLVFILQVIGFIFVEAGIYQENILEFVIFHPLFFTF